MKRVEGSQLSARPAIEASAFPDTAKTRVVSPRCSRFEPDEGAHGEFRYGWFSRLPISWPSEESRQALGSEELANAT